jgi:hypothetical protein
MAFSFDYNKTIFKLPAEVECLCTKIKNLSSAPLWYLVPFHGTTLGAGEVYTFIGNLTDWLQRKRYRTRNGLLQAVGDGKVAIVQLPVPHVTNGTVTKVLGLNDDGDAFTVSDPCWQ